METKSIVKSLLIFGITIGVVLIASYQFFLPRLNLGKNVNTASDKSFGWKIPKMAYQPSGQVVDSGAYSELRASGGESRGLPVRLKIPIIGVDTAIEDAYITPDGRMDVPAGSVNVAWYALGPRPGQIGSAVIGGHFGIDDGVPKVFYYLERLKVGDKVYVVDDNNNTLAFMVRSIRLFGRNADATTVFFSGDGLAHLNVITCEGVWNQVNDSYPDRRVVFTDAIPSEGAVVVKKLQPMALVVNPTFPDTAVTPTKSNPTPTKVPIIQPTASPTQKIATVSSLTKNISDNPFKYAILFIAILAFIYTLFKILKR